MEHATRFPAKGPWTREQVTLALYWYVQTPFGQIHTRNPNLQRWAGLIGRSVAALSFKMVNLASLDPVITDSGRRGMANVSHLDQQVWRCYQGHFDQLVEDAEALQQMIPQCLPIEWLHPRVT